MWLVLLHCRGFAFAVYIYLFPAQERCSNDQISQYWLLPYGLCCPYVLCEQSFTELTSVNFIVVLESPENFEAYGTVPWALYLWSCHFSDLNIFFISCVIEGNVTSKILSKISKTFLPYSLPRICKLTITQNIHIKKVKTY